MPRSVYIVILGALGFLVSAVMLPALVQSRTKEEVYTKAEVDAMIKPLLAAIKNLTTACENQNNAIMSNSESSRELLKMFNNHQTILDNHQRAIDNHNKAFVSLTTIAGRSEAEIRKLKEAKD